MKIIKRTIEGSILEHCNKGKAIIIVGARQVGKTTMVDSILKKIKTKIIKFNGDEPNVRETFKNAGSSKLRKIIGNNSVILIDEAQRILNIGLIIKLIVDNIKNVQVIATGSSSFELNEKIKEPLTGRKYEYTLYPMSFSEMIAETSYLEEKNNIGHRMIFGYYPEIVTNDAERISLLNNLTSDYLYKDILNFEFVRGAALLDSILKALAFQIGNEVSYNEISRLLGIDNKTVEKYIYLLEKSYVIFRLNAFSRNMRTELRKSRKIYFYDNGIRNAIIGNFNDLKNRSDSGQLWENFIISERIKYLKYNNIYANSYFWRTIQQQEIDYIEETGDKLYAYEFKFNKNAKAKFSKTFTNNYKVEKTAVITYDNIDEFLL